MPAVFLVKFTAYRLPIISKRLPDLSFIERGRMERTEHSWYFFCINACPYLSDSRPSHGNVSIRKCLSQDIGQGVADLDLARKSEGDPEQIGGVLCEQLREILGKVMIKWVVCG